MMLKKRKILITGSGGFIASNLIRQVFYTKQNYNIVSIDKVRKNHTMHNIYVNKNHQFYPGDICDAHLIDVIFETERPDVVLHMAAESFVDSSISGAVPFINSNVLGTQVIIDACKKWGVKTLVYTSTDEVTGHLSEGDTPLTEEAPLNPRNPYSATKAAGELLVKAAHETHGLNYIITRSSNNYGPWQYSEKFIPKIIKNVLSNEKIPVYGQGMQMREWLHVNDNVSALFTLINNVENGAVNQTYNISSGQEYRNIEVVQSVCNILGKGHDLVEFVQDRPGHDFRYAIDCSKLKSLDWNPENKFKDSLIQTVSWYVNNQWWFKLGAGS